jgi:tryptophanyl-tRNA synthetase
VEALIPPQTARIMSLRDGARKMSKSDASDQSRINLTDDADTIAQKIRRAKTDPLPLPDTVEGLADRPEARNLLAIYAALSDETLPKLLAEFGGSGFGGFKEKLAALLIDKLAPITAETARLLAEPGHLDAILAAGADRANALAEPIVREAERLVGLRG